MTVKQSALGTGQVLGEDTTGKGTAQETGGADRVRPSGTLEQSPCTSTNRESLKSRLRTVPSSADLHTSQGDTHIHGFWDFPLPCTPSASHVHLKLRTAALSETKQAQHSMFRKRILKQSQKNGNQLSAFFHGREKTSFPMGSRLWLGGEAGRPGACARHSAGGLDGHWGYRFWKQDFIFQTCRLSAAAGWRKVSERNVSGAPEGSL